MWNKAPWLQFKVQRFNLVFKCIHLCVFFGCNRENERKYKIPGIFHRYYYFRYLALDTQITSFMHAPCCVFYFCIKYKLKCRRIFFPFWCTIISMVLVQYFVITKCEHCIKAHQNERGSNKRWTPNVTEKKTISQLFHRVTYSWMAKSYNAQDFIVVHEKRLHRMRTNISLYLRSVNFYSATQRATHIVCSRFIEEIRRFQKKILC